MMLRKTRPTAESRLLTRVSAACSGAGRIRGPTPFESCHATDPRTMIDPAVSIHGQCW